jgi:chromosome segregation ATPase
VLEEQKRVSEQDAAAVRASLETKITELQEGAAQRDSQIAALKDDVDRKDKLGMEQAQQLGELRVRLENLEAGSHEKLTARAQELETAKREREEMQARLTERLQQREAALAQKDAVLEQLGKEVQVAREEKDALTKKLGERLAERERTITEMDERYASMQIEKIQVEERLRVMLEERARLERLMAPEPEANDTPSLPAQAVANASVSSDVHEEESIPIADSNESALLGSSKKAV